MRKDDYPLGLILKLFSDGPIKPDYHLPILLVADEFLTREKCSDRLLPLRTFQLTADGVNNQQIQKIWTSACFLFFDDVKQNA